MRGVRRITAGVLAALVFQIGPGNGLVPCALDGSPDEHASLHAAMIASNAVASDAPEGHAGMPCKEDDAKRGSCVTNPTDGAGCSLPGGGSQECGLMVSCVSVLAEPAQVGAVNDAVVALVAGAGIMQSPQTLAIGPDHPPPRA